jgi:hypothetical protein
MRHPGRLANGREGLRVGPKTPCTEFRRLARIHPHGKQAPADGQAGCDTQNVGGGIATQHEVLKEPSISDECE